MPVQRLCLLPSNATARFNSELVPPPPLSYAASAIVRGCTDSVTMRKICASVKP
jgi:hypothetical protein